MVTGRLQCQLVAVSPKPKKAAIRNIAKVAVMPKLLPRKRVAEMNFDKRNLNGKERVTQRHARVREAPGVQDDEIDAIDGGLLYAVDEFVFGIALEAGQRVPEFGSDLGATRFDVRETRRAVDVGLAGTQKVQIGAVDEQEVGHLEGNAARLPKMAAILPPFSDFSETFAVTAAPGRCEPRPCRFRRDRGVS